LNKKERENEELIETVLNLKNQLESREDYVLELKSTIRDLERFFFFLFSSFFS